MKKMIYEIDSVIVSIFLMCFSFSSNSLAAEDTKAPVIEEIIITQPNVKAGSKFTIDVKASDDLSGIARVGVSFVSPNGKVYVSEVKYIRDEVLLSGVFTLELDLESEYVERGEWHLSNIHIDDKAGNNGWDYFTKDKLFNDKKYFFNVVDEVYENPNVIEDGFKPLESKINVELDKEWTVTFNLDIDIKTLLSQNIYVLDEYKNKVPLIFIIDRENNNTTSKLIISPIDKYKSQTTYTLYIKDILSKDGQVLKDNTKMQFTTK